MLRILHQWVVELRLTGRVLLPGTYIPSLDASHYVTMGVEKNHRLNILFITSRHSFLPCSDSWCSFQMVYNAACFSLKRRQSTVENILGTFALLSPHIIVYRSGGSRFGI